MRISCQCSAASSDCASERAYCWRRWGLESRRRSCTTSSTASASLPSMMTSHARSARSCRASRSAATSTSSTATAAERTVTATGSPSSVADSAEAIAASVTPTCLSSVLTSSLARASGWWRPSAAADDRPRGCFGRARHLDLLRGWLPVLTATRWLFASGASPRSHALARGQARGRTARPKGGTRERRRCEAVAGRLLVPCWSGIDTRRPAFPAHQLDHRRSRLKKPSRFLLAHACALGRQVRASRLNDADQGDGVSAMPTDSLSPSGVSARRLASATPLGFPARTHSV